MKIKNKTNTRRVNFLVVTLMIAIVGVMFLAMDDFSFSYTSLVKQYWGGSFQCVAYVQKYYRDAFGIEIQSVGRAQELYNKAPQYGLYAHRNGGITSPQPGDILVFGHRNKVGHVAIVTGVIKEGVWIAEQNWGTSRITINGGHPLPMLVENGAYTMPDRAGYYVIGWVSRTLNNPGNIFDFSENSTEGWIVENDTKKITSETNDVWSVRVDGKNPTLVSPIFTEGIKITDGSKIILRGKVKGNPALESGKLFLRDQDDLWRYEAPFSLESGENFQEVKIDLGSAGENFQITQMKLMFDSAPVPRKEEWELDWLRIVNSHNQQFPID
jgi:surface antigen